MTAEIGSPTEVHLRILDEAGKELAVSDPQKPTARAEFTAPADGTFIAATEHLNYLFGPGEVYHLSIKLVEPDFEVILGADRIETPGSEMTLLPIVGITKLNGFNGPITLNMAGSGMSGELTIPATSIPTPANPLYLPVKKKTGTPVMETVSVIAKGGEVAKHATATEICRAGLGGLTHLPPGWSDRIAAVEVPSAPIALGWLGNNSVPIGKSAKFKIETERMKYDGEVLLAVLGLPLNVTAKIKPIAKGEKSAELEIVADAKATVGVCDVYIKGTAKTEAGERHTYIGPLKLSIVPAPKKEEPKKVETKK